MMEGSCGEMVPRHHFLLVLAMTRIYLFHLAFHIRARNDVGAELVFLLRRYHNVESFLHLLDSAVLEGVLLRSLLLPALFSRHGSLLRLFTFRLAQLLHRLFWSHLRLHLYILGRREVFDFDAGSSQTNRSGMVGPSVSLGFGALECVVFLLRLMELLKQQPFRLAKPIIYGGVFDVVGSLNRFIPK